MLLVGDFFVCGVCGVCDIIILRNDDVIDHTHAGFYFIWLFGLLF